MTTATKSFHDKVAVVTGGTAGIGRHLVRTLVRAGAQVFFCGLEVRKGRALADKLGPRAHFIQADLADPQQITAFISETINATDHIDYVVNNAGIDPRITFESATPEAFDRVISVNLRSYFLVTHAALPGLRNGTGKAIVNIGTTNYMLGLSPFTVYNSAKAGILGFTRSLARELGPDNIRVNMLSPGWIMTSRQLKYHVTSEDKQELLASQSIPRLLTPSDVTPAILFLLSSASRGVSGQNLIVDGGKVMGN